MIRLTTGVDDFLPIVSLVSTQLRIADNVPYRVYEIDNSSWSREYNYQHSLKRRCASLTSLEAMEVKELRRASSILLVAANSSDGDLAISTSHGTIDSTNLIVTEHEFLFRFFNPDQSFSISDQSGINCANWILDPVGRNKSSCYVHTTRRGLVHF